MVKWMCRQSDVMRQLTFVLLIGSTLFWVQRTATAFSCTLVMTTGCQQDQPSWFFDGDAACAAGMTEPCEGYTHAVGEIDFRTEGCYELGSGYLKWKASGDCGPPDPAPDPHLWLR